MQLYAIGGIMGVHNDMANDAGYSYGTDENELIAQLIESCHAEQYQEWCDKLFIMDNEM